MMPLKNRGWSAFGGDLCGYGFQKSMLLFTTALGGSSAWGDSGGIRNVVALADVPRVFLNSRFGVNGDDTGF